MIRNQNFRGRRLVMNAPEQKPDGLSGEFVKILGQSREGRNCKWRDGMIFQRQHGQVIRYPDSVAGKPEEQLRGVSLARGKDGVRLFPYDVVRDCIQIIGRSLLLVERVCGDSLFSLFTRICGRNPVPGVRQAGDISTLLQF